MYFWLANLCAHLILYWVAFGLSMVILRAVGGMDGIAHNNFLGYFLLHVLFSPACILTGYVLSFAFVKEETAQVMTDQVRAASPEQSVRECSRYCVYPFLVKVAGRPCLVKVAGRRASGMIARNAHMTRAWHQTALTAALLCAGGEPHGFHPLDHHGIRPRQQETGS